MTMEETKRKEILQETFEEWMEYNRRFTDDECGVVIPMTTGEVREQLETVIFCQDDEVAELLFDHEYSKRFFGDHVAWMVCRDGDSDS